MSATTEVTAGTAADRPTKKGKPQLSEGARAERRLGWMLCAPAVVVMLAVTGYPLIYALWLSLERYNLELPQDIKFIGFSNYGSVLTSPYWWQALKVTVIITVFSVSISLVLGMLLAFVMYRTLFGRGTVRTASLVPYGIVTVAAAYGWQYAWTPGQGYLSALFNQTGPLTCRGEGHRGHHPGGDLEDHAVHGAAAAGRALPGARKGPAGRPRRWTARPPGSASAKITLPLLEADSDPGRAAVPGRWTRSGSSTTSSS